VGKALISASLSMNELKEAQAPTHQLALSELGSAVGPSSSGVSERQIQRDTAAIGGFAFSQTADNPAHMAAANAGLMRDAAMQPHPRGRTCRPNTRSSTRRQQRQPRSWVAMPVTTSRRSLHWVQRSQPLRRSTRIRVGVAGAQVHQHPFAGPLMSPPAQGVRRPGGGLAGHKRAVL
jgi:hypothetical protein